MSEGDISLTARLFPTVRLRSSRTEPELVAAVGRGDEGAFEVLFGRYRERIGAYAYRILCDHALSEDVAQEVFIAALRQLRDAERPIAFKPWIYEVAKNTCIDELRRTRRRRQVPLEAERTPADDETGLPSRDQQPDLPSRDPPPDAALESKQRLDDLCGAFRGLSETHHRVLVLRELDGLSYLEIGERLGMSRAVVESTLFRARQRLAEEYEELISGRRCQRVRLMLDAHQPRSGRGLGIKQSRQLSRHLGHCQACRRHARLVGFGGARAASVLTGARAASEPLVGWADADAAGDELAA